MPQISFPFKTFVAATANVFSSPSRRSDADQKSYLPNDILQRVFAKLDGPTLARCSMVDKHWRSNAEDPALWKAVAKARGLQGCALGQHQRAVGVDACIRRGKPSRMTTVPHGKPLSRLTPSADGTRVATYTDADDNVRVFDTQTGAQVLKKHIGYYPDVSLSPSGRYLATCTKIGGVKLSDVDSGVTLASLSDMPTRWLGDVNWLTLASGRDPWIQCVDSTQPTIKFAHGAQVDSMAVSRDGRRLATRGADDRVRIADTATGMWVGEPIVFGHRIACAEFSPNNALLAMGGQNRALRLHDAGTGAPITEVQHTDYVMHIAFSPDSRKVLSGTYGDAGGMLWDVQTGKTVATVPTWFGDFSPDSQLLAYQAKPWLVLVDVETGATKQQYKYSGVFAGFKFSGDSTKLAFLTKGNDFFRGTLTIEYVGKQREHSLYHYNDDLQAWRFTPDSSKIVIAAGGPAVRLLDAETGHVITSVEPKTTGRYHWHLDKAEDLLLSNHGGNIAFRSAEVLYMFSFVPSARRYTLLERLQRRLGW